MQLVLSVCLPRDRSSIPVTRHIIRASLREVGVVEECAHDIAVAQSEACTNVIDHSGPGDEYEVKVEINDDRCVISVVDTGHGFDALDVGGDHELDSERGRGIQLMKALVDRVHFESRRESGTAVYLEKSLRFRPGSLMARRMAEGRGDN